MKFLQFLKNHKPCLGVHTEHGILDVAAAGEKYSVPVPRNMEEVFTDAGTGMKNVSNIVRESCKEQIPELFLQEKETDFAPVVSNPEKIICVGLNYMDHAKETKMELPAFPVLFSKFNNALAAHQETVTIPDDAKKIDYEAELVIVMGKSAKNVSEKEALNYVFGYTAGNDLSARDLQFRTHQWLLGKSPDGFAPVGPYIVTKDEVDPDHLSIECRVNGEMRQQANTKDMIFHCASLISYISQYVTLNPGDLIFTGTPQGVILGYPEQEQVWLKAGDEITVSIGSFGELKTILQ